MDTFSAFVNAEASRGKEMMVFDWKEAARLILERDAKTASAGLRDDWEWTGGDILRDGAPIPRDETYVYLASTWAAPEISINGGAPEECWLLCSQTPEWDENTYWPPEALEVLSKKGPQEAERPETPEHGGEKG